MAYQTINPTTNELIRTYPQHTGKQIEEALAAAHALYKSDWSQGPIQPRLNVLRKFADIVQSRAEELAQISTQEMGKLIGESREEVWILSQIARYYADNAERFLAPAPIKSSLGDALGGAPSRTNLFISNEQVATLSGGISGGKSPLRTK